MGYLFRCFHAICAILCTGATARCGIFRRQNALDLRATSAGCAAPWATVVLYAVQLPLATPRRAASALQGHGSAPQTSFRDAPRRTGAPRRAAASQSLDATARAAGSVAASNRRDETRCMTPGGGCQRGCGPRRCAQPRHGRPVCCHQVHPPGVGLHTGRRRRLENTAALWQLRWWCMAVRARVRRPAAPNLRAH